MNTSTTTPVDLAAIRQRLATARGPVYWRCLEELADEEGFQELLQREFPRQFAALDGSLNRRKFLALLGASLALAGLQGCAVKPPEEKIVPYVRAPKGQVPGKPKFFATSTTLGGYAYGILVESHEGRPTKVEGNPQHPASLGATDVFSQAAVLDLYDPDRSQVVVSQGQTRSWDDAAATLRDALDRERSHQGAGFRLLTGNVTSPTLASQIRRLLEKFPEAKWHHYEPVGRDMALDGARLAFGQYVVPVYHLDRAKVILSLDADFLGSGPGCLRYIRQFAGGRRVRSEQPSPATAAVAKSPIQALPEISPAAMNRLYVVECTPSITGAKADHRWPLQSREIESFARALAAKLDAKIAPTAEVAPREIPEAWLDALVADLRQHNGSSLVIASEEQPPIVHALAQAMNQALGNIGETVDFIEPVEAGIAQRAATLGELVDDLDQGNVETLLILGGNPVFNAPANFDFAMRLKRAALRVHLSTYEDETSELCHWHIPEAHFLEAWSDARAFDGTASIVQPLIAPLYGGKSAHEMLSALLDPTQRPGHEIVKEFWKNFWAGRSNARPAAAAVGPQDTAGEQKTWEDWWQQSLHDGVIANTAFPPKPVELQPSVFTAAKVTTPVGKQDLEIVFRPDPTIYDGRFANNGWLQELPKPLTKLTWDNAAMISPATAEKFGLSTRASGHGGEHGEALADMVELQYRGRSLEVPVWIMPGQPDNTVTLHMGYGRHRGGKLAEGAGFNAYRLRDSSAPWFDGGLTIAKTQRQYPLACTQYHHQMENRRLLRSASLNEFEKQPHFAADESGDNEGTADKAPPTLYLPQEFPYEGYKWGMVIDLSACVGCNACITACQAENNIPVVGKEQVTFGREMHWVRVDRYFAGELDNPRMEFQPVPCMQCENAPCELVCPVGATVHSSEGLNDMVYNRCVGTRYCSNNCPYKVRRFNFLQYSDYTTESLKLLHNPEVTVRSRGVMEKCTYCVQRITSAKIDAEKHSRHVRDGEILTACQAACPAEAIVFGDLNDPQSQVARWQRGALNYTLLSELNTRPRTSYLAALRNPNPQIETL